MDAVLLNTIITTHFACEGEGGGLSTDLDQQL